MTSRGHWLEGLPGQIHYTLNDAFRDQKGIDAESTDLLWQRAVSFSGLTK